MKNNFENSRNPGKNPGQDREKLIEKALKTLAMNIEFADAKEPISLKDRLFQAAGFYGDFDKVQVVSVMGEYYKKEGSIFLRPCLVSRENKQQDFINSPMDLSSIEPDQQERLELADAIWSGVSLEEKKALALNGIEWNIGIEENRSKTLPAYSAEEKKHYAELIKRRIKTLSELKIAIQQMDFVIEINDLDASLIFSPKK